MARDLIAMGIGGWVGTALVIGYFYVQNVHFDLKTVAVACLLPFTIGICTEVVYYIILTNSFLLSTMLLPEVIVFTTTLMGIATIAFVLYTERCGLRFLNVRDELRADQDEGEEDEEDEENEEDEEDEDQNQDEGQDEDHIDETDFENDTSEDNEHKDDHDDNNNDGDSDDEKEDTHDTTESESDEEEVCIVTPPPARDSRDIIAELGMAELPALPA